MGEFDPRSGFGTVALDRVTVPAGARFGRIFFTRFPDSLGYGKGPSRFSDPRRRVPRNRFDVLYLGSTLKVCFVEAVLRDQGDGRIGDILLDERDLAVRSYAEIEVAKPLSLVDLRNDGPLRMGIPSDVAWFETESCTALVAGDLYASRTTGWTHLPLAPQRGNESCDLRSGNSKGSVSPSWRAAEGR